MTASKPKIESSWYELLKDEFHSDRFAQLRQTLVDERSKFGFYPPAKLIFNAFDRCPVEMVKVVILGQDPYHGPGQAHGLCFSVNDGIPFPPSLMNIFKELNSDIGMRMPHSGNLTKWAEQGVLLLNSSLTVRVPPPNTPSNERAGTHSTIGWERFTDAAIRNLSDSRHGLVFLLWGSHAQKKQLLINNSNGHLILKAPHPSPLSVHRGFFGCRHFSRSNEFLRNNGIAPIDWDLNTQ